MVIRVDANDPQTKLQSACNIIHLGMFAIY